MPGSFYAKITPLDGPEGSVDPGYGQRPPYGGARPDNELPGGGHIWGAYARLIAWLRGPHVGGGPAKPPGFPILPGLPPHIDNTPPTGRPSLPGDWVPVDPGYGRPPIWGFLPVDPGFGVGGRPGIDNSLPGDTPGHWVPVDPDYGQPVGPCGGERPAHIWGKPLWVWIAEIGPSVGLPIAGTPEPKK